MSTTTKTVSELIGIEEARLRKAGVYLAMYSFGFLFFLPYWFMVVQSILPTGRILDQNPYLIPPEVTLQWYEQLFASAPIVQWIINTIILAGGTTIVVLVIDSMIAFSITRLRWPGRTFVFSILLASFMIPAIVNLIPIYTIISDLGLLNTFIGIILPLSAGALGVFLLVQFFKDFPDEIEEAAQLDGFSTFQIYSRLMLPMMKPALTALGLFTFISTWNQFLLPLVLLQDEMKYTLPIGLVTIRDAYATVSQPGLIMASSIVASLPLLVVFLLLQKHLIRAVEMQAVGK